MKKFNKMVTVFFPSLIYKIIGDKQIEVQANTLGEVINILIERYGASFKKLIIDESGEVNRFINFYIYGKRISSLNVLEESLNKDDKINILIIITGG